MNGALTNVLNADRQRAVENVRQAAARLWERPAHRHAVDHGPAHADRVAALLNGLTGGLTARAEHRLAAEEVYFLLAAAYPHAEEEIRCIAAEWENLGG